MPFSFHVRGHNSMEENTSSFTKGFELRSHSSEWKELLQKGWIIRKFIQFSGQLTMALKLYCLRYMSRIGQINFRDVSKSSRRHIYVHCAKHVIGRVKVIELQARTREITWLYFLLLYESFDMKEKEWIAFLFSKQRDLHVGDTTYVAKIQSKWKHVRRARNEHEHQSFKLQIREDMICLLYLLQKIIIFLYGELSKFGTSPIQRLLLLVSEAKIFVVRWSVLNLRRCLKTEQKCWICALLLCVGSV